MKEATILRQFFQDQFGSGYDVQAFRNAVKDYAPPAEIMRIVQSTEDIIEKMIYDNVIRAVLRTSQSDYIGLSDVDGASFTWSLEFAAPTDSDVAADIERIRKEFTEKIIPVSCYDENYDMLLVFTMPAQFAAQTINGVNYIQTVWGGRGTIAQKSVFANEFSFYIDGQSVPGVLSLSDGFTSIGENYTTERASHQRTALQTFTNAVGLSVHASKDHPVIERMIAAAQSGTMDGFVFEIKHNGETAASWEVALFNQVNVVASLGSYVMIDVQILRS